MDIRQFFFKFRSYTPIPLLILMLYFSEPFVPAVYLGITLVVLGESIRIWAVRHAGGRTRTRKVGAKSLVMSGPFAYIRNPLYLGNILLYTGIVFIAGGQYMWILFLVALVFFIIQYSLIVSLEEETLTRKFDNEYLNYCENVPALLPRLKPFKNQTNQEITKYKKVLKPEKSTLINIAIILILIFFRTQISF
jgi:protein-S-isoprenylcysteine O-methyltransferase Ste14